MKIELWLEHKYEATYYEDNDGNVRLEILTRPDSNQNEIPRLSPEDAIKAQAELESAVEQAAINRAVAIQERRQMAGDYRRERARDDKMMGDFSYSQWKL